MWKGDRFVHTARHRGTDDVDPRKDTMPRRPREDGRDSPDDDRDRIRNRDRDYLDRTADRDRERARDYDWDRDRDRDRDRTRDRDWERERDRDRDRDWERERDRERDRDRERGWDRLYDRDRDRGRDSFGRDALDVAERDRAIPKGPAAGPSTIGRKPPMASPRPRPDVKMQDIPSRPDIADPQSKPDTGRLKKGTATDSPTGTERGAAGTLLSLLQKCREVGELEHDKAAVNSLLQKREADLKSFVAKHSEFPSVVALHRQALEPLQLRREKATRTVQKTLGELSDLSRRFLSELQAGTQPCPGATTARDSPETGDDALARRLESALAAKLETSLPAKLEDSLTAKLEKGVMVKLEDSLTTKLEGALAARLEASLTTKLETSLMAKLEASRAAMSEFSLAAKSLENENVALKGQLATLSGAVDALATKLENMSAADTRVGEDVERLVASDATHRIALNALQGKVDSYGRTLAEIDLASLAKINAFLVLEQPDIARRLQQHDARLVNLQQDVAALRAGTQLVGTAQTQAQAQQQQKGNGAAEKTTAAAAAAAAGIAGAPVATAPLVFPGDDFASVRIEIGSLNEKITPLAQEVGRLASQQAKIIATQQANMNKLIQTQTSMSEAFGNMLDKEAEARHEETERVSKLEDFVLQINALSSAGAKLPPATAGRQNEREMSGTPPGPSSASAPAPTAQESTPLLVQQPNGHAAAAAATLPTTTATATATSTTTTVPTALTVADAQSVSDVASASTVAAHASLLSELQALQARVQATETRIQGAMSEIEGRCATLQFMFTTLDTQYNNLTTKELFSSIVGHMEKLYPNARQLQQDMESLVVRLRAIEQHDRASDEAIRRIAEAISVPMTPTLKRSLGIGGTGGGPNDALAAKRRKTNGSIPPENGRAAGATT
ncbi:hypothetical protein SPI_01909 [Niveomyces insectorum RCEF 264]|uniref:Uncharacterized protein n=1 Tax=Niveomyces insectorum RCEF 264 TaxID=1081102 RepID=A0A167ZBZ0_9HYPO|nr:hypothetical protein SPI_01909 [Niveomyces insectorum RCEF 264]